MRIETAPNHVQDFLQSFFGPSNRIRLEAILTTADDGPGVLKHWIKPLLAPNPEPTVLPYRSIQNNDVVWYGIAFSERQLRQLVEELIAFAGPTYSTLRGMRSRLDSADPIDRAVLEITGGTALKFKGSQGFWNALELMRQVRESKPQTALADTRPVGRVLRDFYMALRAGDQIAARNCLDYFKDKHLLDALNISFLKVQMLAEENKWNEIMSMGEFNDLVKIRRPIAVTQALISAIYRCRLLRFEEDDQYKEAVEYFKAFILPEYANLFQSRGGIDDPTILKAFMLFAAANGQPQVKLRNDILSLVENGLDGQYIKKVASLVPVPNETIDLEPLELAKTAIISFEYEIAFEHLLHANNCLQRAGILVNCAMELQTLEVKRAAIDSVMDLSQSDRERFLTSRINQTYWQTLTGEDELAVAAESSYIPDNWVSWLTKLNSDPCWRRATEVANQGAREWPISQIEGIDNAVDQIVNLLHTSRDERSEELLHCSLPHLLSYFQKDEFWPRRDFLEIYECLLDILVISTEGADADLSIFNDLVTAIISLGISQDKYGVIVSYAQELWDKFSSPAKLDWILDFMDMLLNYPCPLEQERLNLFIQVTNSLGQYQRRVDLRQRSYLEKLFDDINRRDLFSQLTQFMFDDERDNLGEVDIIKRLNHKSIAIYSLTETVPQRVKEFLQINCENIVVHISHDKSGNDRLKHLSRTVDLFVIATASAKHSATLFIEACRPNHMPIIRPAGKGSASMLRSIYEHLSCLEE